jgi:hypothetical protein
MRKLGLLTLALAVATLGSQAWGHVGHGTTAEPNGFFHYLTEPFHLLPWIALAAVAYVVVRWLRSTPAADRN